MVAIENGFFAQKLGAHVFDESDGSGESWHDDDDDQLQQDQNVRVVDQDFKSERGRSGESWVRKFLKLSSHRDYYCHILIDFKSICLLELQMMQTPVYLLGSKSTS